MRVIFLLFILFVMASAYRRGGKEPKPARPYRHFVKDFIRYNHNDVDRNRDDDSYDNTVDDSAENYYDNSDGDSYYDSDQEPDGEYDGDSDGDYGQDSDQDSDEDNDQYILRRPRPNPRARHEPHFVSCFGKPLNSDLYERPRPIR